MRGTLQALPYVSPHSVRASFISVLQANGTDVAVSARLVGHKIPNVTLQYYTHSLRDDRGSVKVLDAVHSGPSLTRVSLDRAQPWDTDDRGSRWDQDGVTNSDYSRTQRRARTAQDLFFPMLPKYRYRHSLCLDGRHPGVAAGGYSCRTSTTHAYNNAGPPRMARMRVRRLRRRGRTGARDLRPNLVPHSQVRDSGNASNFCC